MSSYGATSPEEAGNDDVALTDVDATPIDSTSSLDDPPMEVAESATVTPQATSDESEPEPELTVTAEPDSEPESEPEPTEAEPEPQAVGPRSEPEPEPQPDLQSEPEPRSEPEPEPQPDAEAEPEVVSGSEPLEPAEEPGNPPPSIGAVANPSATPPIPSPNQTPAAKAPAGTGRIVEGVVTEVTSDHVELTLDDGRPAVINRRNFSDTDEDPTTILSVGDRAFGAELARDDPKKRVVLSRSWALKRRAWEKVVACSEAGETLTGKVVSTSSKGLVVDVGVRGFVPSSHLELSQVADVNSYADQSLELKILEVDPRREKLVLSRRSLLLRAQRKEAQELLSSLQPGETRTGTVASLADYGAFVDLGGVSGLVHISEMSWQRVAKPSDVVAVGDQIEVKVLEVKAKKKRISLSLRQTTPDPLASLEVGLVVTGRVTRLVDFGAFVAIGDIEGLVHLSELAEYRVGNPEEVVAPGDEVGVKILSVDQRRRRVELSIRRAAEYGG